MAGIFGGMPPRSAGGMSEPQQQEYENRQAAIQRLAAQNFQQSWYLASLEFPLTKVW
jgi:hypothetical protein